MKKLSAFALLLIVIFVALYVVYSPTHIFREMSAVTHDGDIFDVTLDITIRRTLRLEQRVHGSITIGDTRHVSAWDTPHFSRPRNRLNDRREISFDVFFPYYLEVNSAQDAFVAL